MLSAAYAVGSLSLGKIRFYSRTEKTIFSIALGMGLCAMLLFVLGLLGALYRPLILALTFSGALLTLFMILRDSRLKPEALPALWKTIRAPGRRLVILLGVVSLAYLALLLLSTLYPPLHWDATASHLVLAREYLIEHKVVVTHGAAHPILPALNHLLFTWALALKDDILAQMVELCFLILTAAGLLTLGLRVGKAQVGFAAAALWLSHPLSLWLGESGYVDVGATFFAFLGIYAMRIFRDERDSKWWLLASAMFGMAAGIKMPALFFPAAGALFGLWSWFRSNISKQELAKGFCMAFLTSAPWYGFIAYHTGNPFWPMFPQLSRGEWGGSVFFEALVSGGGLPKTFFNFLLLPYYLAFRADLFFSDNDRVFFLFVIFLPLAWVIAIWHSSVRWWAVWILVYSAYWFTFASFLRYWLPIVPIVGLCIYESIDWILERSTGSKKPGYAVLIVLALITIGHGAVAVRTDLGSKGRNLPVTEDDRRAWLTRLCAGYRGVDYINSHANPDDKVYIVSGAYLTYYVQPKVAGLLPVELDQNPETSDLIWPNDNAWLRQLETDQVNWILIRHNGLNLPETSPFNNRNGRSYELVYAGEDAYVFHRTPIPSGMIQDAARLKRRDPCSDSSPLNPQAKSGQSQQAEAYIAAYSGLHEKTDCEVIEGWAWDANKPDCPIYVNIYEADRLLITIPANRFRNKLAESGMGNGRHAFSYNLPQHFRDGRSHSIRVTITETGETLKNSPITIRCPLIPSLNPDGS